MADLNHDGRLDLVAQDNFSLSPQITTYFGQPDGSFAPPQSYNSFAGTNSLYLSNPAVGDFNQDGNIDVIVPLYASTSDGSYFHWAQFYSGNPDGTLTPTADISASAGPSQSGRSPIWMEAESHPSWNSTIYLCSLM